MGRRTGAYGARGFLVHDPGRSGGFYPVSSAQAVQGSGHVSENHVAVSNAGSTAAAVVVLDGVQRRGYAMYLGATGTIVAYRSYFLCRV